MGHTPIEHRRPLRRPAMTARETGASSARAGVTVHTFPHLGKGNLNEILSWDGALAELPPVACDAAGRILELVVPLGGTLTGEHGVGPLNRTDAAAELGEVRLDVHRAMTRTLDPHDLLNPGNAL